jgi:hypothetical protein
MNDEKVNICDDELSKIVEQLDTVKGVRTNGGMQPQHLDEFIREVGRLEGLLEAIIRPKYEFLDDDGLPDSVYGDKEKVL